MSATRLPRGPMMFTRNTRQTLRLKARPKSGIPLRADLWVQPGSYYQGSEMMRLSDISGGHPFRQAAIGRRCRSNDLGLSLTGHNDSSQNLHRAIDTQTAFVTQFTSDYCLELIMWLELTRKKDQHDDRLPDHLPVKQSQAWCRFGTVIGQTCSARPHQRPRGRSSGESRAGAPLSRY